MKKKSQEDLEQVAKIYEQIRADNPPELSSPLIASSFKTESSKIKLPSKLKIDDVSRRFLWEDVISSKKLEISENILITAEKAKAVIIKNSEDGDLYQFKGSDEWLTLEDYSETLLHQPFDDQLTHLFRFLLVDEFSNDKISRNLDDYEEMLRKIYFDKNTGSPSKFLLKKALQKDYSLCVWEDKSWFEYDTSTNYLEEFSLKSLIDRGIIHENLKNKYFFDGLINSITNSIHETIEDFSNPFAEYETLCLYLIPFEGVISFTLIAEKLEKLGYKNKDFIISLSTGLENDFYLKQSKILLTSFLKKNNFKKDLDNLSLRDLLIETNTFNSFSDQNINQFLDDPVMGGLQVLLALDLERNKNESNVIQLTDITKKNKENDYSIFLPWWYATNNIMLEDRKLKDYKSKLEGFISNRLTKNKKFYQKSINRALKAYIPMRVLEDFGLQLANLPLNTHEEVLLGRRKRRIWKEIDQTILNAYQYKISRSALSLKLQILIEDNKPILDKASKRLEQLLDLYENTIINN